MPRRKVPNPNATTGWEGEVRQDRIDKHVGSEIRLKDKSSYDLAYGNTIEKIRDGVRPDEIRLTVKRQPRRNPFQAPVTATQEHWHEIHERTESELCRIQNQAIEDALDRKPPHYQPAIRY